MMVRVILMVSGGNGGNDRKPWKFTFMVVVTMHVLMIDDDNWRLLKMIIFMGMMMTVGNKILWF